MPIKFEIRERGPTPLIMAKELRPAQKNGFEIIGKVWHKNSRPKHFTKAGAREYGYTPRVGDRGSGRRFHGSYTEEKLKSFGHTKPLVFTGLSERFTRVEDVRTTSKGGRVVMNAPAFNFRNPNSKIDMRAEMTEVSSAEQSGLVELYDGALDRMLNRIMTRRATRIS